jgi:hypothetical protein
MAHPLITIESRGSNKNDLDGIDLSSLLTHASVSDARTRAIKPSYYHATTTSQSASHNGRDNTTLTAESQMMASSTMAVTAEAAVANDAADISTWRLVNIVLAVAGISFLSSFSTGVLIIGIPSTAADIGLSEDLILW